MNKKRRAGFTLVELIVVIAILGILAAVAIPAYNGYIKKAHEAANIATCDAIKTAAIAACAEKGAVKAIEIAANSVKVQVGTDTTVSTVLYPKATSNPTEEQGNFGKFYTATPEEWATPFKNNVTKAEWPTSDANNSWKFTPGP